MKPADLTTTARGTTATPTGVGRKSPIPHLRWWICGLLFMITTINYLDRQSLAILRETINKDLHWSEADYGWINFSFQTAYAIFMTVAGRLIDVLGVKMALGLAIGLWSLAVAGHAFARDHIHFCIARFALGAAESANFPASIKAVAQWFPQKERALGTGLFNSGSNVGIMLAPLLLYLVVFFHHWQIAFVIVGLLGLIVLASWLIFFQPPEKHTRLDPAEYQMIKAGQPPAEQTVKISWTALLRCKQVWPFLLGKFMTDPVWWFYLYWLPPYLAKERGMVRATDFLVLMIPYLMADIGSIFGGWFSGHLIKRGFSVGSARYIAMLTCALCMPGALIAVRVDNFWLAIFLISMATAGHQGWSANIFTTATDMFPSRYAGSVVGLGGSTGALGGMFMTLLVGMTLQWFPQNALGYKMVFTWAGVMHLSSLAIYMLIVGRNVSQVDIAGTIKMGQTHKGLMAGGLITTFIGAALSILMTINWAYLVTAMKGKTGPAGGLTAAVGVLLIGLVLVYAAFPKKENIEA
ncbi:MFS transporter [bacterium]|nr:MFS transporter [bacterium]